MKVGFRVDRIGYYRYFGRLVERALEAGADVVLLHRDLPTDRVGWKAYQWADPRLMPTFRAGTPRVVQWPDENSLVAIAEAERLDAIVTVWAASEHAAMTFLRGRGVAWVALQDAFDFHPYTVEMLLRPDVTCVYSAYWVDLIRHYYGDDPRLDGKLQPTGWPELDWFAAVDRAAIRWRLGIPEGVRVVTIATYKHHLNDPWEQVVFRPESFIGAAARAVRHRRPDLLRERVRGVTYASLLRAVRVFCDRNGAVLLSKARGKDAPPRIERQLADRCLIDMSHHPPTIVEVAAITDVWISFLSASTLEAVCGGAYNLSPLPSAISYWLNDPWRAPFRALVGYRTPGSIWNYPGVVGQPTIAELIEELPTERLSRFQVDQAARREYVSRFLGGEPGDHSRRTWDAIMTVVAERRAA